jgi:LysM domain
MPLPASQVHGSMQRAMNQRFPNGSLHAGQYTLVFRIRHKHEKKLVFKEHRLILMPQRFTQTTEARTALYYTQGGAVADVPAASGVGMTFFQIQGHTGFGGVRNATFLPDQGPVRQVLPQDIANLATDLAQDVQAQFQTLFGTGVPPGPFSSLRDSYIDGAAAIKDLQETILAYFYPPGQRATRAVTQTQDLQLEFLNLTAPVSDEDKVGQVGWIIHPHRNLVDLQQDAAKPFLYSYTFQFAALAPLSDPQVPDVFETRLTTPRTGLQTTLAQLTALVRSVTNGVNTLEDACTQMVIQQVTGPVTTFIQATTELGDAVGNFMTSAADKIRFPLYAQRAFSHVLDAPKHSVTTLAEAAKQLGEFLFVASDPRSLSKLFAGTGLTDGVDDALTLSVNHEPPVTLRLGTQTSGAAIAAAIEGKVRALPPAHAANATAYRDFTCTFADGQYVLSSGTKLSDSGLVTVLSDPDTALVPNDAARVLGLGLLNGGQEHAGSAYPAPALALLRGVEQACAHLQGFPDYFADQLEAQDAALTALLPAGMTRTQIRGDQRLSQTRITPGDSLQGIAARVGVDWQTLALVNRLTYPFVLEEPTTLARGRVSSATTWTLSDGVQAWAVDAFQGQRVDIVYGTGAGQSRRILRNTPTELVLETAWEVVPTDTSDYAIRSAANPILRTGVVASASARTLTESGLTLIPGSQRGLTLVLTSGATAGARRRVSGNDGTTYTVEPPWDVVPAPSTLYLLEGPRPATQRQKLVGDLLSVPQPSAQTPLPIRGRLQDVSAITGQQRSVEERLFGRDLLLDAGALVWDVTLGDARTLAGLPNLRQALIHYINVPLGEIEYAPGLGSYVQEALGVTATVLIQTELLGSVERTIRQDRRILRMSEAQLVGSGGATLIVFSATAVDGSTVARIAIR